MKTAVLIAMFFSGLHPGQQVLVRIGPNKPLLAIYSVNGDGTCNPVIPLANPQIVDSRGEVAFCVTRGTKYLVEIK